MRHLLPDEGRAGERDRFHGIAAARMKKSTRPRTTTDASSVSRVEIAWVLDRTKSADRCTVVSRRPSSGPSRCAMRSWNSAWPDSSLSTLPSIRSTPPVTIRHPTRIRPAKAIQTPGSDFGMTSRVVSFPSHHGTRKSRLRIPCAPHPADFGPCRDAAVEPAPPLRPARPCLSSSPQPFAFRVKRGHFEHDRPVRAAENRDVEFAPRLHVPGTDERKGDRFPDRIPVRA